MSTDLCLAYRDFGQLASDRQGVDLVIEHGDLKLVSERANLTQAIINRLLTRRGELTSLGHPDYGSRLYQLIGEPNSRRTQALAELYIRESLESEPRIRELVAITFTPLSLQLNKRATLEMAIVVMPGADDGDSPVTIAVAMPL